MSVRLAIRSKLPVGGLNGLAFLGGAVRDDPGVRVLIALVSPVTVTENLETGDEVVGIGFEQVELVNTAEAIDLARRLYERRTGKAELPLDGFAEPTNGERADAAFARLRDALGEGGSITVNGRTVDTFTGEVTT
jgi:hypothetical protein